jgi:hypothetical protein
MMRLAAGAAVGTVAYQAGKRHEARDQDGEPAEPAAAQAPAPAATAATDPTAELERLAQLHSSGALTDAEFTAAKAKLLG